MEAKESRREESEDARSCLSSNCSYGLEYATRLQFKAVHLLAKFKTDLKILWHYHSLFDFFFLMSYFILSCSCIYLISV